MCKFIPVYPKTRLAMYLIETSIITEKNWPRILSMDQIKMLLSTQEHKAKPVFVVQPDVQKANQEKKAAKERRSKANKDLSTTSSRTTLNQQNGRQGQTIQQRLSVCGNQNCQSIHESQVKKTIGTTMA